MTAGAGMWRWWILMMLLAAGVPVEPSLPIPLQTRTFFTEQWGSAGTSSRGLQPVCLDIPSNLSLCYGVGYRQMRLPNLLEHDTMAEVWQQASSWVPLVNIRCHADAQLFLCSLFSPVCLDRPIYPCRSLCDAVRRGCEGRMRAHGYPWPDMFRCDKFPQDNDMCIASQSDPPHRHQHSGEEHVVENANDECRPCKQVDTFENVLDNLCRADFAVRAKRRGRSSRNGRGAGSSHDGDLRTARVLKASGPMVRKMVRDALPALPPTASCPACAQESQLGGVVGHLRGRDSYLVMGSVRPDKELEITFVLPWTSKSRAIKKAVRTFTSTNCTNPNLVSRTVIVDTYTPVEGSPMGPIDSFDGFGEPHLGKSPAQHPVPSATSTTTAASTTVSTSTTTGTPTTLPPVRPNRPVGRNRARGRQNSHRSRRPDKINEVHDAHSSTPHPSLGSADFFDSHLHRHRRPDSVTRTVDMFTSVTTTTPLSTITSRTTLAAGGTRRSTSAPSTPATVWVMRSNKVGNYNPPTSTTTNPSTTTSTSTTTITPRRTWTKVSKTTIQDTTSTGTALPTSTTSSIIHWTTSTATPRATTTSTTPPTSSMTPWTTTSTPTTPLSTTTSTIPPTSSTTPWTTMSTPTTPRSTTSSTTPPTSSTTPWTTTSTPTTPRAMTTSTIPPTSSTTPWTTMSTPTTPRSTTTSTTPPTSSTTPWTTTSTTSPRPTTSSTLPRTTRFTTQSWTTTTLTTPPTSSSTLRTTTILAPFWTPRITSTLLPSTTANDRKISTTSIRSITSSWTPALSANKSTIWSTETPSSITVPVRDGVRSRWNLSNRKFTSTYRPPWRSQSMQDFSSTAPSGIANTPFTSPPPSTSQWSHATAKRWYPPSTDTSSEEMSPDKAYTLPTLWPSANNGWIPHRPNNNFEASVTDRTLSTDSWYPSRAFNRSETSSVPSRVSIQPTYTHVSNRYWDDERIPNTVGSQAEPSVRTTQNIPLWSLTTTTSTTEGSLPTGSSVREYGHSIKPPTNSVEEDTRWTTTHYRSTTAWTSSPPLRISRPVTPQPPSNLPRTFTASTAPAAVKRKHKQRRPKNRRRKQHQSNREREIPFPKTMVNV